MIETKAVEFTLDLFAPLVGETFEIEDDEARVLAVLIEASNLREAQGAGRRSRQFSLVWRGPPGAVLPQRIYTVQHPVLGAMELFLVCITAGADGARYEAVFT
ncbi:MAG: DUF6916 family protein [Pseudomarimonas sp.]